MKRIEKLYKNFDGRTICYYKDASLLIRHNPKDKANYGLSGTLEVFFTDGLRHATDKVADRFGKYHSWHLQGRSLLIVRRYVGSF